MSQTLSPSFGIYFKPAEGCLQPYSALSIFAEMEVCLEAAANEEKLSRGYWLAIVS